MRQEITERDEDERPCTTTNARGPQTSEETAPPFTQSTSTSWVDKIQHTFDLNRRVNQIENKDAGIVHITENTV